MRPAAMSRTATKTTAALPPPGKPINDRLADGARGCAARARHADQERANCP